MPGHLPIYPLSRSGFQLPMLPSPALLPSFPSPPPCPPHRLPPSSSSSAIATDCVYRARYSSAWLLPLSLADFPYVHSTTNSDGDTNGGNRGNDDGRQALRQLLEGHGSGSGRQHSWLSLGSFGWSTQMCARAAATTGETVSLMRVRQGEEEQRGRRVDGMQRGEVE